MERKIINELIKWKVDSYKRPLLLSGISGCGKTHTVIKFGKDEYKNIVYFDCDQNLELTYVIEKNTTKEKLIKALSAISLETILKEDTLIVFDNVSDKVLVSIKKLFTGEDYHIIMITNDDKIVKKHKTEGINYKKMDLVTFPEYLKYVGKEQLVDFIEDSFKNNKSMPFHTLATELYNDFVLTGGYPSAITKYNKEQDYNMLGNILDKNIKLIKYKLIKLDNLIDIKRGQEVYNNISIQLLKDNKKFQYGNIKPGARSKEYEKSIEFMQTNKMIIKSTRITALTSPISKNKDEESFKLYYNDSGILYKKLNVSGNRLITNTKLLELLYENNIVQTLSNNGFNIYHYHSGGKAYIDIVIQTRTGKIIPIEILHGEDNTKSKSMTLSMKKYNLNLVIRFGNEEFKLKNNIKYIPYYAAFCIVESL